MNYPTAADPQQREALDPAFGTFRLVAVILVGAIVPIDLFLKWVGSGTQTDFKYFWDAGAAVLHGQSWHSTWFPYPPHALFLFIPFALVPMWPAYVLFDLLGVFCFLVAARPYVRDDFPKLLSVLTPAALFCLFYGQTGLIVGALWLLAFRGSWPAVALLTIKPHIGVLSLLSLNRKTLFAAFILAIVLFGAAALIFGEVGAFFQSSLGQFAAIGTNTKWNYVGVGPAIGYGLVGWLAFAGAAALLMSVNVNAFTAATAALLIAPYAFHYDMPAASLGFLLALHKERSPANALAFTSALLVPSIVRLGAWTAPPVLLWALWSYNGKHCLAALRRL